jgi:SAM-dependent methyltransferase
MTEHTGTSYEGKAKVYAETVDTKPWNAYYERPALVSLLPCLTNAKVLDAGCGSGWYAEYLLDHGATVTAFDFNAEFVSLTQSRVGKRAHVLRADLASPLDFAKNGEFDVAVCPLVMHYLKDWQPVFREFHRVLKPSGVLVFSTHHPFMDWKLFKTENYFAVELLEDDWGIGKIRFYRRPLTVMSKDLDSASFFIERLLEPQPTEDFRLVNPKEFERLTKNPQFLFVRARKKNCMPTSSSEH